MGTKIKRTGVLQKPPGIEVGWATKIAQAKEAHEEGRKARQGKSAGVYSPRFTRRSPA